jgi:hypothetical protein
MDFESFQILKDGFLDATLNGAMTLLAEEKPFSSDVEFSKSVAAAGGIGLMRDRAESWNEGNMAEALGPGVAFWLSEKGKVQGVYREIAELYNSQPLDMNTLMMAGRHLLTMPSGSNNLMKGLFMMEYQKGVGKDWVETDQSRTTADGIAKIMGFGLEADSARWNLVAGNREHKQEVKEAVTDILRRARVAGQRRVMEGGATEDTKDLYNSIRSFKNLFHDHPKMLADINREIQSQLQATEWVNHPMKYGIDYILDGQMPVDQTRAMIDQQQIPIAVKTELYKLLEYRSAK